MWLVYLILGALLVYLGAVAAMALAQTRFIFPTALAAANRPALPASAERLEIEVSPGERLAGMRLRAQGGGSGAVPLLLGFGGNAWNADATALYLHDLFPGAEVVAFHYRGYPPSGGRPSARALLGDALAIFDHLQLQRRHCVIAVGFSLGAGVAAYLARHRRLAGMILVTPFDSLEALAREHFPWAPVGLLLRHRMPTVEFVQDVPTPAALIAAGRDTIVPARRSEPLRRAIPTLILDRTIADAGHNDLYGRPAFTTAMHEAFTRMTALAAASTGDGEPEARLRSRPTPTGTN